MTIHHPCPPPVATGIVAVGATIVVTFAGGAFIGAAPATRLGATIAAVVAEGTGIAAANWREMPAGGGFAAIAAPAAARISIAAMSRSSTTLTPIIGVEEVAAIDEVDDAAIGGAELPAIGAADPATADCPDVGELIGGALSGV